MTVLSISLIIFGVALLAGFVGSLTGLGGGIIVTPALTLLLGVDIRYAIGASLVSVIATSSGSASAYVRDGLSNIRIGMFLEIATTFGALFGAFLALYIKATWLTVVFGLVLLQAAWQMSRKKQEQGIDTSPPDPLGVKLKLAGVYKSPTGPQAYEVHRVKEGFAMMFAAGTMSGLLGIGSGMFKVLAMDKLMRLPFKVSTATSNFMIGVTAAASAGVYLSRGYIEPILALPVMLGVLVGSLTGAKLLPRMPVQTLRAIFAVVVGLVAIQMIASGFGFKW
ncbi:MAG: permease [Armatimonadetes bacterium 55-13]|nr:sulfite exporter TauE/SafE family protein [Armatimonadota bacterium]OJU63085.1 MAG: permease [Armatimonadetes bacterium 55-13]